MKPDVRDSRHAPPSGPRGSTNERAPPSGPRANGTARKQDDIKPSKIELDMEDEDIDPDEDEVTRETRLMKRLMGFSKFRTTKNTKVPGNSRNYGVRKEKTTEYRQYMNRQGGFNRPLSPG